MVRSIGTADLPDIVPIAKKLYAVCAAYSFFLVKSGLVLPKQRTAPVLAGTERNRTETRSPFLFFRLLPTARTLDGVLPAAIRLFSQRSVHLRPEESGRAVK